MNVAIENGSCEFCGGVAHTFKHSTGKVEALACFEQPNEFTGEKFVFNRALNRAVGGGFRGIVRALSPKTQAFVGATDETQLLGLIDYYQRKVWALCGYTMSGWEALDYCIETGLVENW